MLWLKVQDILIALFGIRYPENIIEALLKSKNISFEELNIWQDPSKAKEMLQRTNGARTIPQIFIEDHYIGGNEQLQEANRTGELDKLLTKTS